MKSSNVLAIAYMAMACAVSAQTMDEQMMDHQNMDHAAHMKMMAESQRQTEVSQRGKDVMYHGYTQVINMAEGIEKWTKKGFPIKGQSLSVVAYANGCSGEADLNGGFDGCGCCTINSVGVLRHHAAQVRRLVLLKF
jgi:hypothetical protein